MAGQDKHYLLIKNMPDAFTYHRLLPGSEGNPADVLFLEVNAAETAGSNSIYTQY